MSAITIEDELVHYEVLGRGKPIILVHGWLGSWRYWIPTMQQLMVKYRCYALDLWGFGDSGKDPNRYSLEQQIDLLNKFMARMGMLNVVLVGHGLGAAIVAQYAVSQQPSAKVHRMFLVSPPLVDAPPNSYQHQPRALTANIPKPPSSYMAETLMRRPPALTDTQIEMPTPHALEAPNTSAAETIQRRPDNFAQMLQAAQDSAKPEGDVQINAKNVVRDIFLGKSFDTLLERAIDPTSSHYEKLRVEVHKADRDAIDASLDAFAKINTFRDMMEARVPLCVVLGDDDKLLPKPEENMLNQLDSRQSTKLVVMENRQHYPMLEDKFQFVRLLKDFLEADDVNQLEMKEEWRRRKR